MQPGEKVAFDTPLVTVVDLKEIELQAMVPAVDIPELKPGMAVELAVDGFGERRFTGRIERINPSTEPGTRAILVFVGVPNPNNELRGGMFATGRISLAASAPVMSLPAGAVRSEAGPDLRVGDRRRQARQAHGRGRPPRRGDRAAWRSRPRCRRTLKVLAARFENLKEGAPALVKATGRRPPKASATATARASS